MVARRAAQLFDAQDWCYRVRFDAPPPAPGATLMLGFDGLATLAQVQLNGRPLLDSDNMFVAHECDVSDALEPTGNELLLRFRSLDAELAHRRPRPRWRSPMLAHQQLRWFRTTLLGRTPGWSPPAAVVGPWRDIWLERRDGLQPRSVNLDGFVDGTAGIVRCRAELTGGCGGWSASPWNWSTAARCTRKAWPCCPERGCSPVSCGCPARVCGGRTRMVSRAVSRRAGGAGSRCGADAVRARAVAFRTIEVDTRATAVSA